MIHYNGLPLLSKKSFLIVSLDDAVAVQVGGRKKQNNNCSVFPRHCHRSLKLAAYLCKATGPRRPFVTAATWLAPWNPCINRNMTKSLTLKEVAYITPQPTIQNTDLIKNYCHQRILGLLQLFSTARLIAVVNINEKWFGHKMNDLAS